MAQNESRPYVQPADTLTGHANAALVGRRGVMYVAGQAPVDGNPVVGYTAAGGIAVGITAYDVASGGKVTLWRGHAVHDVDAGAAVAPGDVCKWDASGRLIPQGGTGAIAAVAQAAVASGQHGPFDFNVWGS